MNISAVISCAGLFKGLPPRTIDLLSGLAFERRVSKKELLFVEGDEGHSIYLLASGSVQLYKTGTDGSERVLKVVQPGELFAEAILFETPTFPVSAVALADSILVLIPKREILALLGEESFRNDFIAHLLQKQRYLVERLYYLTSMDVEERFFKFLSDQYGGRKNFHITLSKKDLAAAIGTTPESLSRLIQELKKSGRLSWEGTEIKILD